jgi:hypothetical protein
VLGRARGTARPSKASSRRRSGPWLDGAHTVLDSESLVARGEKEEVGWAALTGGVGLRLERKEDVGGSVRRRRSAVMR